MKVSTCFVVPDAYQAIIDDKAFPLILREDNVGDFWLGPSPFKSVKYVVSSDSEDGCSDALLDNDLGSESDFSSHNI